MKSREHRYGTKSTKRKNEFPSVRFENPLGSGKKSSDKKFFEKDLTAEITDVRSGYNYLGITIVLDLI